MGFLIFVTEQSVYIHQYCWREGVNIRLLTKFKGDTPKGWQRYCTTKPQNFIDVCMVGSANSHLPTPPPHHAYICKITRLFSWAISLFIFNKSQLNLASLLILRHSFWLYWWRSMWRFIFTGTLQHTVWKVELDYNFYKAHFNKNVARYVQF